MVKQVIKQILEDHQIPLDLKIDDLPYTSDILFKGVYSREYTVSMLDDIIGEKLSVSRIIAVYARIFKKYESVIEELIQFSFGEMINFPAFVIWVSINDSYFYFSESGVLLRIYLSGRSFSGRYVYNLNTPLGLKLASLWGFSDETVYSKEEIIEVGRKFLDSVGLEGFPLK